jgi:hypothetical protein
MVQMSSTHNKHIHEDIGSMLYYARKNLATKLNLKMISRRRLFNYCKYGDNMPALEYANKVLEDELRDPALSLELDGGFKSIKKLSNYLDNVCFLNYASFIERQNPMYRIL